MKSSWRVKVRFIGTPQAPRPPAGQAGRKFSSRRERFEYYLDSGRPWDNPLPPALRVAAEWAFGTLIFATILMILKRGFWPGIFMLVPATLMAGLTRSRGSTSPASWWFIVLMNTIFGAFLCFVMLVEP